MALVWDEDKNAWAGGAAITDQSAAAAAPTKAEFDSLAGKFNSLLAICRDAGLVASD